MSGACVDAVDEALAWTGGNLATITERWADEGPRAAVLALCGEHDIPARLSRDVLELLRVARSDVQHLVRLIERLRGTS